MITKKDKKRYYIIGIGGVAMGNLAKLLKQKGHKVAGSDQEAMYEPMKGVLHNLKIKIFSPYNALHVKRYRPDIIVVGNAISRGNLELEYAMSNGHIYRSVSDILREEFIDPPVGKIGGKKAIVVAGTHGKTTTSALIAWILEYVGYDPTIFVGGVIRGFPPKKDRPSADMRNFSGGAKLGKGKYIVIEGDEYNTAFFDKNPKIYGYRPYIGIVNNIELDHIDIYKDMEQLKDAFAIFTKQIPLNGLLVFNADNIGSYNLLPSKKEGKKIWGNNKKHPQIITFGIKHGDYLASNIKIGSIMTFHVKYKGRHVSDISSRLIGSHNVSNILAAISVAGFLGIPKTKTIEAISCFTGVKRRMEIISEANGITVIDDYAHHPTAVYSTISAIRSSFHGKRIIVVFEPGSASSKKRVFEDQYFNAFLSADTVLIYKPYRAESMKSTERFSGKKVANRLNDAGITSKYFDNVDKLMFHVKSIARSGDIVLVMSCRGFDGLREKLIDGL
ncbi:MAG: Mur ligase family protein [Patescibacteria group bacterium]